MDRSVTLFSCKRLKLRCGVDAVSRQHLNHSNMAPCALCTSKDGLPRRAIVRRPKTAQAVCRECFFLAFETEVHNTIMANKLFRRGERVGVAASGGKGGLGHALVANRLQDLTRLQL